LVLQAHEAAQAAAEASFYEHLLGRRQAGSLKDQLAAAIAKEHKGKVTANVAESNTLCQALEMECTKQLAGGGLQVPSMYQFEGKHKACMKRFQVGCRWFRRPCRVGRSMVLCCVLRACRLGDVCKAQGLSRDLLLGLVWCR
jgi:hypothetical protein